MFGAALCSAELDNDEHRLSELIVGAPAYVEDESADRGAIYIYLGGNMVCVNYLLSFGHAIQFNHSSHICSCILRLPGNEVDYY